MGIFSDVVSPCEERKVEEGFSKIPREVQDAFGQAECHEEEPPPAKGKINPAGKSLREVFGEV